MQWLNDFAQWLLNVLLYIPRWIWSELLTAFAAVISLIPVPEAVTAWSSNIGSLSSSVIWFLSIFQFKLGLTLVMSAYVARWLLRRIPFIGG